MKGPTDVRRRRFLKAAATAAAGPMLSCGGRQSRWRFFSEEEAETLNALCEQIIPADQDAGGAQAGVVNYIDRHLMGHFKRQQQAYREGLAGLDRASLGRFGKKFAQLAAAEQTGLLSGLSGELKQFFEMAIAHTMQGFYGDPRHGGNRDAASWKMLGVPLIPVRGRAQYDLSRPGIPDKLERNRA